MTTYIWNLPARGENTFIHLTLSKHFNKTVVYGPAKWRYLIHRKVPRFECISLVDWTKQIQFKFIVTLYNKNKYKAERSPF